MIKTQLNSSRFSVHWLATLAVFVGFLIVPGDSGASQSGPGVLFGDLTVDEKYLDGPKGASYDVILYFAHGRMIARQRIANGGQYRFSGLTSGDYDLVVEFNYQEVGRIRVNLTVRTGDADLRRDIGLQWKQNVTRSNSTRPQTVSAADFYDRSAATKTDFESAQSALEKKNYVEAEALLKKVLQVDPKDFQAWTELGTVLFLENKETDADEAYVRALKERPTFFLALLNLGRVRMARKKYADAIEPLSRAVEAEPTNAEANLWLGEAFLQIKKGSKAVGYLNEAARLGKPEAHLRLAALYDLAGLKDMAAAEYEQFIKKRPDYADRKKLESYIKQNSKR